MGARHSGVWIMSVDLLSGYSGYARFRTGYCCRVQIVGDQDRTGAFEVSTEKDYGPLRKRIFGFFCRDGKSYWDQWPDARWGGGRLMPFDQEIVEFAPEEPRPADLVEHYEACMI